jgi:hypothetical protein
MQGVFYSRPIVFEDEEHAVISSGENKERGGIGTHTDRRPQNET